MRSDSSLSLLDKQQQQQKKTTADFSILEIGHLKKTRDRLWLNHRYLACRPWFVTQQKSRKSPSIYLLSLLYKEIKHLSLFLSAFKLNRDEEFVSLSSFYYYLSARDRQTDNTAKWKGDGDAVIEVPLIHNKHDIRVGPLYFLQAYIVSKNIYIRKRKKEKI